jgi:hypothetical protein
MLYEVRSLPKEKLEELYIQESYKLATVAAVVDHNTVQAIKTDLASIITELAERGLMDFRTN